MAIELTDDEKKLFIEELTRLNNITNTLWQQGLDHNFSTMSHTEIGVNIFDNNQKIKNITSILPGVFRKTNNVIKNSNNQPQYAKVQLNSQRNFRNFMSLK